MSIKREEGETITRRKREKKYKYVRTKKVYGRIKRGLKRKVMNEND